MDDTYVLLHSAAYGRYLGVRIDYDEAPQEGYPVAGFRVVQCIYNTPQQTDIMWEALGWNGGVLLRPRVHPEAVDQIALHCTVEAIPPRPAPPQLPDQIPVSLRFLAWGPAAWKFQLLSCSLAFPFLVSCQ